MVLGGSRDLVSGGHVTQVAAVLLPTVVEGLALKECRGGRQVGARGHGQVVVRVRGSVLDCAGEVWACVVVGVVVGGR